MKYFILLAFAAMAVAQVHEPHNPDHGHGDPLHNMIHQEVVEIMNTNAGISVDDCTAKCDALFDLSAGHDEEISDRLCHEECMRQSHVHPSHQTHTHHPVA